MELTQLDMQKSAKLRHGSDDPFLPDHAVIK